MDEHSRKKADSNGSEKAGGGRVRKVGWWAGAIIGALATMLGVIFNLDNLGNLLTDRAQQRGLYTQSLDTVEQQVAERKYDLAWAGIEKAVVVRTEQGWKLSGLPSLADVQAKEADVAMAWLRDIHLIGEGTTFTAVVERLEPALQREELRTSGSRRADLVAHLGYADFLRSRDGQDGLHPEARYQEALRIDPTNPFANAMLGHWRRWNGGSVPESEKLFAVALQSKREGAFVRRFQLAAFATRHNDDADFAFLRTVDEMRKRSEFIDDMELVQSQADRIYYFNGENAEHLDRVLHAMPTSEHLELVHWLLAAEEDDSKRIHYEYFAALLEEESGQTKAARDHLIGLRSRLPEGSPYRAGIKSALHRLGSR